VRFWWVNQNQTYRQEVGGGYLWSPQRKSNGAQNPYYDFMREDAVQEDGRELICTEKDAVKLWRTHPQAWAVPLVLAVDPGFWSQFDSLLDAKLSSAHGPETS